MRIDVITLFPDMFRAVLGESILKLAQERGEIDVRVVNLRDFAGDRRRTVDDRPFGGGPGMVLKCEPVMKAVRAVEAEGPPAFRIITSPQGARFDQKTAQDFAKKERLLFICGHYEGYDERIVEMLSPVEVSVGDYILTGGELPAMTIIDAVVRLLPGVLGAYDANDFESFSSGLLEYPQYTRPVDFEGRVVPPVLRSGDPVRIAGWRRAQAIMRTRERRPEMLGKGPPGPEGPAGGIRP